MQKDIEQIKVDMAEIKVDLKHHIKRTELLEDEVRAWRNDLKPVQKHVTIINGLGHILLWAAAISGAIVGILQIL